MFWFMVKVFFFHRKKERLIFFRKETQGNDVFNSLFQKGMYELNMFFSSTYVQLLSLTLYLQKR